jgi:hypothetical protein
MLFAEDAVAGCADSDLEGKWRVYATVTEQSATSWMNCALTLSSRGFIAEGACQGPGRPQLMITSGRISIADTTNCVYSGRFELDGMPNKIDHATLSAEKTLAIGVGSWTEGFFSFSMIKTGAP